MGSETETLFKCSACGSEHRITHYPTNVSCECGRLFEVRSKEHIVVKNPTPTRNEK